MTSKHPAVKPKRYSSQRQRQTTAEESLPQTLEENPAAQNAQYYDPTQQQSKSAAFVPVNLLFTSNNRLFCINLSTTAP